MRSLVQFLAFASSALCAVMVAGTLVGALAHAEATVPLVAASCANCCPCQNGTCVKSGNGRGCTNFTCTCTCNQQGVTCSQNVGISPE
jgi:hypothetical protein